MVDWWYTNSILMVPGIWTVYANGLIKFSFAIADYASQRILRHQPIVLNDH